MTTSASLVKTPMPLVGTESEPEIQKKKAELRKPLYNLLLETLRDLNLGVYSNTVADCVFSYAVHAFDWRQRPELSRQTIQSAFLDVSSFKKSTSTESVPWMHIGKQQYRLLKIQDHQLALTLIHTAPSTQKEFHFVDHGAGEFQWGRALGTFLQAQKLPSDIRIHIIGTRGEPNRAKNAVRQEGQFHFYEFGSFNIEEMEDEFPKRGLDLVGKVDLAVTRWTLCHVTDSHGTAFQIMHSLKPGGIFLFDTFYALSEKENPEAIQKDIQPAQDSMVAFLRETEWPFLMREDLEDSTKARSTWSETNQFMVRRPSAARCNLTMSYAGLEKGVYEICNRSKIVTRFQRELQDSIKFKVARQNKYYWKTEVDYYFGDRSLFEWLEKHQILVNDSHLGNGSKKIFAPFSQES